MKVLKNLLLCTFMQHTYRYANEDMLHENESEQRTEKRRSKGNVQHAIEGRSLHGSWAYRLTHLD